MIARRGVFGARCRHVAYTGSSSRFLSLAAASGLQPSPKHIAVEGLYERGSVPSEPPTWSHVGCGRTADGVSHVWVADDHDDRKESRRGCLLALHEVRRCVEQQPAAAAAARSIPLETVEVHPPPAGQ
jgi:hypothetical protein